MMYTMLHKTATFFRFSWWQTVDFMSKNNQCWLEFWLSHVLLFVDTKCDSLEAHWGHVITWPCPPLPLLSGILLIYSYNWSPSLQGFWLTKLACALWLDTWRKMRYQHHHQMTKSVFLCIFSSVESQYPCWGSHCWLFQLKCDNFAFKIGPVSGCTS